MIGEIGGGFGTILLNQPPHHFATRLCKFGLHKLDGVTGRPIADELYDRKDPLTIKTFLEAHLDPTKQTFVVTDLYSSYPGVFGEFFGET